MLRLDTYSGAHKRGTKLQEQLYQQVLQNSNVCDVTLVIHDTIMKAHWCVLVGCPYFQSLHDSGMKESLSGKVVLNFGDSLSTKAAIQYLYTGELKVTLDNVHSLLSVADYLQLSEMTDVCKRFLDHTVLTINNCVQVMLISSQFNLTKAYEHALKYVSGHLPELLSGSELLDITPVSLRHFITDPTLSYVKREDLFDFLIRWTEKDKDHRMSDFEGLFKALDLQLVTNDVLSNTMMKHPLVSQSQPCQLHCMGAQVKGLVNTGPGQSSLHDVIIVCGGLKDKNYPYQFFDRNKNGSARIMAYFPEEQRWALLPNMPYGIKDPVLCVTDQGKVLVANSFVNCPTNDSRQREQQILRFCPRANSWDIFKITFPSADKEVVIHSLLCLQGRLFAVISSKNVIVPRRHHTRHKADEHLTRPAPIIRHLVQLLELDYSTKKFKVCYAFCQRNVSCELRVVCQQARSGPSLDGSIIYFMGNKLYSLKSRGNQQPYTKLFCYDIKTGQGREVYGHKMTCETLAFGLPDGFVSTRLGKASCQMFQQDVGKVVTCKDRVLPLLPDGQCKEEFSATSLHDEVYITGGKDMKTAQTSKSTFKFSFLTKCWTELEPLPEAMVGAGIARGKMGVDVLRCHIECPHCYYQPFENKNMYQNDQTQALYVSDYVESDKSEYYYGDSDFDFGNYLEDHELLGDVEDEEEVEDVEFWGAL